MPKLRVLVAGAGLGGLCLAQILKRANVDVCVFERDGSPWDRPQGYRLHLDIDGISALREALPPRLYELFEATSMRPVDSTTIVDTNMKTLKRVPNNVHGGNVEDGSSRVEPLHLNVNRATLRETMLSGLEYVVQYKKQLTHYESQSDGVVAYFTDGSEIRGDVLVGADGIRSIVRESRASELRMMDSGIRAIYGRVPMNVARTAATPQAIEDVFTVATDDRKVFLGLGPVIFPTRPEIASKQIAPEASLSEQDDYLVAIVGGRQECFPLPADVLRKSSSVDLQRIAAGMLAGWSPMAQAIPSQGDPTSFFFVEMYSSVPGKLDEPTNVTLLGDAIHSMTPTLGRGANLAMRDASLLGRRLASVRNGNSELATALRAYEAEMIPYGFDVVRQAARMGQHLIGQEPLPV